MTEQENIKNIKNINFIRLKKLGLVESGEWTLDGETLTLEINEDGRARRGNVLYAFIGFDNDNLCEILYIGKTEKGIITRMGGYFRPGPTQTTNRLVNSHIIKYLEKKEIKIYSFIDMKPNTKAGFDVNLVAGLEGSVISQTQPEWNQQGKNKNNKKYFNS
jgi:hypothetical protein